MTREAVEQVAKALRRGAILLVGGAILVAGVAMIVLPGPAFVAIPAGLGLLGIEFEWARRLRERLVERTAGRMRAFDEARRAPKQSADP